jgi:hypothetical protein
VFAKAPVLGAVKTRLVPALAPEQARRVHVAALTDTVERAARSRAASLEIWLAGAADAVAQVSAILPGRSVRSQAGGDLGERLVDAFTRTFADGCERAVVLGSDHPTLPVARIAGAFAALDAADVVLGPSDDGGYYAVGLAAQAWPRARGLFLHIPWSSARVLETTLERARTAHLAVTLLETWYDLDRPDDLERAFRDARPDSAIGRLLREPAFARARRAHAR